MGIKQPPKSVAFRAIMAGLIPAPDALFQIQEVKWKKKRRHQLTGEKEGDRRRTTRPRIV
jgi:hypothetical protein